MKNLTPAMRQYLEVKAAHPDCIVLFRMGDFYEMFFDDARLASRVLGIALTSRDREREIPMCGVPFHSAASYLARLVKEGHKAAICEQITDPKDSKGLIERAVTRVITPGTVLEDELLDAKTNNYIAAVVIGRKRSGLAYMDVSTGEFRVTETGTESGASDELLRIMPLELLIPDAPSVPLNLADAPVRKITLRAAAEFDYRRSHERLLKQYGAASLDGFGLGEMNEAVAAAGALLNYVRETQRSQAVHLKPPSPYLADDCLVMDHSTRRNLELAENVRAGGREGTLLDVIDLTKTAMGGRRLRSWLLAPLRDRLHIIERHEAVEELMERRAGRERIHALLNGVSDIERLAARVAMRRAAPRDLVSLKTSLSALSELKELLAGMDAKMLNEAALIDDCADAASFIGRSISDAPPMSARDGGVIRPGFSAALDELRGISAGGKESIARIEAEERAATGVNSLKVGYNRVFGYYIEVTRANSGAVPPHYMRKQTLVNAERFITPGLKEWEEKVVSSEERGLALEAELYAAVLDELSGHVQKMQTAASQVAAIDCLASLALRAEERGWRRPVMDEGGAIAIEGGRHPVVEAASDAGFVANDLRLGAEEDQIIILTGPNMAGKSTYLRQCALIVIMAQMGSFVPADKAAIGIVDRVFTRVGASDDLARGQSTFMVEMSETANILNNATPRSLVILDEIGRGTSTFDGLSIAWAVVEYLHGRKEAGAKTIFATHYHELTELSLTLARVKNYNMSVKEWEGKIIFLRKVVPGGASRSYGIAVAKLAGIPEEVVARSREILKNLEAGELVPSGMPRLAAHTREDGADEPRQLSLLGERDRLRDALAAVDMDDTTPLEALTLLTKLKEMAQD
ncbi:MAG: DNA mismatch repair protein MutS [Deltaproteobacteria bacterium]|nr:DNA mismatch repair protein MutS [Deltaproteobacteria bacterium]